MNDHAYYERRDKLLTLLRRWDQWVTCAELADALGWSSAETRAKLMSLRADGLARHEGREWRGEHV